MKIRSMLIILVCLLLLVLVGILPGGVPQTGATPALISFTDPAEYFGQDHSLGYRFTANSNITVSALGFYDDPQDGPISLAHDIGIFAINGVLLASATVTSAGTQEGLFRYADLSSDLNLTSGADYYIAGVVNNDGWVYQANNIVTDPAITYVGSYFHANTTVLTFPESYAFDRQYMTVNFQTTPIPEPATMLLLGSGLIGLAGYGRKQFFQK